MIEISELTGIRNEAHEMANVPKQNPRWTRAWERLEDAANGLRAMMEANTIERPKEIGE